MKEPKAGVYDVEEIGMVTVELSYSRDEGDWGLTITHAKDSSVGAQRRHKDASVARGMFVGAVTGLRIGAEVSGRVARRLLGEES